MDTEEFMTKASVEKTSLDRTLLQLEDENSDLRQHVDTLQTQLSQVENDHTHRSPVYYINFISPQEQHQKQYKTKKN